MLLLYGMRRGEVLGLRWSDIDETTIRVRQQVQRVTGELLIGPVKTRAGKRDLPLLGLAEEALMIRRGTQFLDAERLGDVWTDTGLVFSTRTGLPLEPRNLNRSFERVCDINGIRRVKVHALRHTTASLLKALGVPPKDAQVILGHANASTTTQIYTHVDQVAMRTRGTADHHGQRSRTRSPHRASTAPLRQVPTVEARQPGDVARNEFLADGTGQGSAEHLAQHVNEADRLAGLDLAELGVQEPLNDGNRQPP